VDTLQPDAQRPRHAGQKLFIITQIMLSKPQVMVAISRGNPLIDKVSCTKSGIASIRTKASHPANRRRLVSRQTAPRQPTQLPGNLVITDPPQLGTGSTNADSLSCEAPHCEARHQARSSSQAKASPLVVGMDFEHLPPDALNSTLSRAHPTGLTRPSRRVVTPS